LQNNISQNRIYQLIIWNFSKTNNPRIRRIIFSLFRAIFATWRHFWGKVLDKYLLSKQFWLKSFFMALFSHFLPLKFQNNCWERWKEIIIKTIFFTCQRWFQNQHIVSFVNSTPFHNFFYKNQLKEIY
jgi:hypothetical protein